MPFNFLFQTESVSLPNNLNWVGMGSKLGQWHESNEFAAQVRTAVRPYNLQVTGNGCEIKMIVQARPEHDAGLVYSPYRVRKR